MTHYARKAQPGTHSGSKDFIVVTGKVHPSPALVPIGGGHFVTPLPLSSKNLVFVLHPPLPGHFVSADEDGGRRVEAEGRQFAGGWAEGTGQGRRPDRRECSI